MGAVVLARSHMGTDVFGSVNNTFLVTDQVSSAARVWFQPLVGSKVAAEAVSHMV